MHCLTCFKRIIHIRKYANAVEIAAPNGPIKTTKTIFNIVFTIAVITDDFANKPDFFKADKIPPKNAAIPEKIVLIIKNG